jgi:hypothetical protein
VIDEPRRTKLATDVKLLIITAAVRLKHSPIHNAYPTEAELPKREKLRIDRLLPIRPHETDCIKQLIYQAPRSFETTDKD